MLMSEAKEQDDKRPNSDGVDPTKSYDGSVIGPGGQIGPFRIEQELGHGGAGVVYLAHDTKLDRSVAIKSLPVELMENPKARSRFSREARVLASLNHPNIATIYDEFEVDEGVGYLILEYVPGQTLSERIAKKPLKLEEALTIALQIAEAMAAAHEHDVVHRDLKPSNIKITSEGKVKVLDFGLAKAVRGEALDEQSTVTESGRVIGTPAYMSPEQARSKPADKRSDIWSFGCVLYEMLSGRVPFKGETVSDTLANILQADPDWQALPQTTPANIQVLLRRCLEKNPHRRLRDIGDAGIEISETLNLLTTSPSTTTPVPVLFKAEVAGKPKFRTVAMIIGAAIIVVLCVVAVKFLPQKELQPSSKAIRLVVLPFENLGPEEDEYFAAGITDAVTARLAGIHGLGVISRQSAMQYKKRERNIKQIAKELGVDYILEGTVQRERPSDPNSKVRIRPQLIKAFDDTHVWAQTYDNDMSEIFRIQTDLAERVALALDVTLLEPERRLMASRPTENMEAYDYCLRGDEYNRSYLENDVKIAIRMYDKAIELDPTFAIAYARLSSAHVQMYWFYYDRSEERLALAKRALDKAVELDPDRPEVRKALGWYYYHGDLDYDRALEQFEILRKSQPNSNGLLTSIGYVQRRQGKFEQAVANLKKASELDPLFDVLPNEIGETLMLLRQYSEAERYFNRAIYLSPDWSFPYAWKAWLYLLWEGNTERARVVIEQAPQNIGSLEYSWIVFRSVVLNIFDRDYQQALDRLSSFKLEAFNTQFFFIPKSQLYAQINGLMGNQQLEKANYESARSILETKIQERPEDSRFHSALAIAYAGLDRKEDAIREGKLAVELLPVSKDAWRSLYRIEDLAKIYVMVGEFDLAIDRLEFLLFIPGEISVPLLRLDPAWDPLRDHPRFKKLVEPGK